MTRRHTRRGVAAAFASIAILSPVLLVGPAAASWHSPSVGCPHCQRVVIYERILHSGTSQFGTFTLRPLTKGSLKSDSGYFQYIWEGSEGTTLRGRDVTIDRGIDILHGRHGILTIARTLTLVIPDSGSSHGTSNWMAVGGNGVYAQLSGSGRGVTTLTPSETQRTWYRGTLRWTLP